MEITNHNNRIGANIELDNLLNNLNSKQVQSRTLTHVTSHKKNIQDINGKKKIRTTYCSGHSNNKAPKIKCASKTVNHLNSGHNTQNNRLWQRNNKRNNRYNHRMLQKINMPNKSLSGIINRRNITNRIKCRNSANRKNIRNRRNNSSFSKKMNNLLRNNSRKKLENLIYHRILGKKNRLSKKGKPKSFKIIQISNSNDTPIIPTVNVKRECRIKKIISLNNRNKNNKN